MGMMVAAVELGGKKRHDFFVFSKGNASLE